MGCTCWCRTPTRNYFRRFRQYATAGRLLECNTRRHLNRLRRAAPGRFHPMTFRKFSQPLSSTICRLERQEVREPRRRPQRTRGWLANQSASSTWSKGTPMWFRSGSSACAVVPQFRQNCLVGSVNGVNPFSKILIATIRARARFSTGGIRKARRLLNQPAHVRPVPESSDSRAWDRAFPT